jgi:hypothetical protein
MENDLLLVVLVEQGFSLGEALMRTGVSGLVDFQ